MSITSQADASLTTTTLLGKGTDKVATSSVMELISTSPTSQTERYSNLQAACTWSNGPVQFEDSFPLQIEESYKVIGYIDDIKPAVTSMEEFNLIDRGSALFEAASGCILHRDPTSGKVKLLPLGRLRGTL